MLCCTVDHRLLHIRAGDPALSQAFWWIVLIQIEQLFILKQLILSHAIVLLDLRAGFLLWCS